MAERSTISVKMNDNKWRSVYCHKNGCVEHNGYLLIHHYYTQELAEELISFGDISYLSDSAVPKNSHDCINPEIGVNIYYGRDCNEVNTDYITYSSYEMLLCKLQREEYNYAWIKDQWFVLKNNDELIKLSDILE